MNAQGAVLRPMGPSAINRPIPISIPGRRFSTRKWIQGIGMKKGSLRKMAPRSAFKSDGTLKKSWIKKASHEPGVLGKRARLAKTIGSFKFSRRSRRSRSRSRRHSHKSKVNNFLQKKMKENMHKWKHGIKMKNGKFISSQKQASAISYSQTKKKYPRSKL